MYSLAHLQFIHNADMIFLLLAMLWFSCAKAAYSPSEDSIDVASFLADRAGSPSALHPHEGEAISLSHLNQLYENGYMNDVPDDLYEDMREYQPFSTQASASSSMQDQYEEGHIDDHDTDQYISEEPSDDIQHEGTSEPSRQKGSLSTPSPAVANVKTYNDWLSLLSPRQQEYIIDIMAHYWGRRIKKTSGWVRKRIVAYLTMEEVKVLLDPNVPLEVIIYLADKATKGFENAYAESIRDVGRTLAAEGFGTRSAARYLHDVRKNGKLDGVPAAEVYHACIKRRNKVYPFKKMPVKEYKHWMPEMQL